MIIAITGTPGTGKSTLSVGLKDRGIKVLTVREIAERAGAVLGYSDCNGAWEVDVEACSTYVAENLGNGTVVIEGHMSHLLPTDYTIVLRLSPKAIAQRLTERGYPMPKVMENLEAEALDVIMAEAVDRCGTLPVFEMDVTGMAIEDIRATALEIIEMCENHYRDEISDKDIGAFKRARELEPGHVNWTPMFMDMIAEVSAYGIQRGGIHSG